LKDLKILVLEGGFNEEHEISIETGKQVKQSLLNLKINFDSIVVEPNNFERIIKKFDRKYLCFNALHGTFGEDGNIQKILDKFLFKYTHSSSKASATGFDKALSKKVIKNTQILTPNSITIDYQKLSENIIMDLFGKFGSIVIKPISSGSSFGIKIFKNKNSIFNFLKDIKNNLKIYKDHPKLLIEKYIEGRELTVAVVEKNKESFPLEVTEIKHNNEFFDYKSKYTSGYSSHILPAKLPRNIYDNCKTFAKIAHDSINCRAVSRSDFIYDNKNIYFLEINTQPGLTPISLVPEQLKYKNVSFDEMLLNIIKCSL